VPIVAATGQEQRRGPSRADEQRREAAIALIERYDRRLRRTARRFSVCADDAEDAYQRAMEILLTKAPVLEPERLVRWMHTVTRHEAYAVRRQREKLLGGNGFESDDGEELDPIDLIASEAPEPDVGAERNERVSRGFEALHSLKPQEIRTLTLKAEGYSYEEIREITGFSRTKINRCMVEGRRRFLKSFSAIEEGQRCDELSAALSAFADHELSDSERPALIEHISGCAHCRAKLREYRRVPKQVLGLAPVAMLGGPSFSDRTGDRLVAAADHARDVAASFLQRGSGALDASQAAAAGGGPRGPGLAVIGVVCGIGAAGGGAAYCLDPDVLPNALGGDRPAVQQAEPTTAPTAPLEADIPAPVTATPRPEIPVPTPVQQQQREFGASSVPSSSGETREFGPAPTSSSSSPSGGGSGGGSSGASGFGFEK
jgi:RNA polymerase sigma factor (sigma-70 family)